MPKLSEILFGKEEKREDIQYYTPEQQQYMDMLLQQTQQPLQSGLGFFQELMGGGDEAAQRMSAPYMRQFQEQTVPELAQRFASMGALDSSAFTQQLGAAGAGLSENLAALRENLRMQALGQLPNIAGIGQGGLQRRFETMIRPGTSGIMPGLLAAAGTALGGPLGGMVGGAIGGGFNRGGGGMSMPMPSMDIPSSPIA